MIFTGLSFNLDSETLNATPTHIGQTERIQIQNGIFDHLQASHNVVDPPNTNIHKPWDFDTVIDADFDGDLHGGNFEYTVDQVSHIRIKRRKAGTLEWTVLYEIPIVDYDSFHFERFDRFARSNEKYEYAIVPVINGAEGAYTTNTVVSKFDGVFIMEKDSGFNSLANITATISRNKPSVVITPIDRQYPFVFGNGIANYSSGTVNAIFLARPDYCHFDFEESWKYRREFMEFLCDGRPKILKFADGKMFLIAVTDSPTEAPGEHDLAPVTTFNWVEIGRCENGHDLYVNGLIDIDIK